MDKLKTTGFPLLSRHMPQHQPVHYDGFPVDNHTLQQQYEADDWVNQGKLDVIRTEYRKTRSQDNLSDRHGIQLSGSLHQRVDCELRVVNLLSAVLSVPTPLGIRGHRLCPDSRDHELGCTNSCSSLALAESESRKNQQSPHHVL